MKITILDGYTLNPGDLSWQGFADLGDLTVHDRTPPEEIIGRSLGSDILITNKTLLLRDTIAALPVLRYIGVLATGYNVVDIEAAAQRDIPVTNIPSYGTRSVAQMVFAHILELCHRVQRHSDSVHEGRWTSSTDFCYWEHPLIELSGKVMGIIGFGRIGAQVGAIAAAMGMSVLAYDNDLGTEPAIPGFRQARSLEEVFRESDIVSLHCPLTEHTRAMVNRDTLRLMKKSAFIINSSRGPLVADADLAEALNSGTIAGAGLDVLSTEPPEQDNPLLTAKNCLITPHIAWATFEARKRLMDIAVENLRSFLAGKAVNVVNR
ncbi:MAG: glycerate dehydrogenase [Spirochaetae bacterium HGW-Spirochaetae-1]|nr:MAG: glycerate dehydrogenase [Spirochaetae bacterium HGW-Spirochaetae-1]